MARRLNRFHVVVIGDYNDDDAHGIVRDNLYYWLDANDISILGFDRVDVRPFNTVQTGYMLARRALNPLSQSEREVFFVNTAPRMDDARARAKNQGEGFVAARLANGKQIFAVNSGFSLAFVKRAVVSLKAMNVPDDAGDIPILVDALRAGGVGLDATGAGQFRSGYIYPVATARALAAVDEPLSPSFKGLFGPDVDPSLLPDIPDDALVFRDGYGNLKTSVQPAALEPHYGALAVVACNGQEVIARISPAIFDVANEQFSFAPGSTILAYGPDERRQFTEIVLRGGNAARAFARAVGEVELRLPNEGAAITWRLAEPADLARLGYSDDGTPPEALLEVCRVG